MGGNDKMIDLSILKEPITKYVKAVFLIPGTGTDRLIKEKIIDNSIDVFQFKNFQSLIKAVSAFAKKGDTILLSPGFASFGMFVNEYDRGEKFISLMNKYFNKG
jgi:UDP-N-acetylmuramoylalanine--D-glutamate ligase